MQRRLRYLLGLEVCAGTFSLFLHVLVSKWLFSIVFITSLQPVQLFSEPVPQKMKEEEKEERRKETEEEKEVQKKKKIKENAELLENILQPPVFRDRMLLPREAPPEKKNVEQPLAQKEIEKEETPVEEEKKQDVEFQMPDRDGLAR